MKHKTDILLIAVSAVVVGSTAAFAVFSRHRKDEITVTVTSIAETTAEAAATVYTGTTKAVTVKQTTAKKVTTTAVTSTAALTETTVLIETEPPAEPETEHILTLEEAAPININTADADTLMLLPHVDEEAAAHIIELREAIGGYSHVYELLYIDELEQNEVAEIVEFVTVGQ